MNMKKYRFLECIAGQWQPPENANVHSKNVFTWYEHLFGAWPTIIKGQPINGGIPALGNLQNHLQLVKQKAASLPIDFTGILCLDMEAWCPLWAMMSASSYGPYKSLHLAYLEEQGISLPPDLVWDMNAKEWLIQTVKAIKEVRPYAKVGYYNYPGRYSYWSGYDNPSYKAFWEEKNNALYELWAACDLFLPSIYQFYKSSSSQASAGKNKSVVKGVIDECVRLNSFFAKKKTILPFTWYRYHSNGGTETPIIEDPDLELQIFYPYELGANGAIIWGYEATPEEQEAASEYFTNVLYPKIDQWVAS